MLLSRNGIDSLLSIYKGYANVKVVDKGSSVTGIVEYFDMEKVHTRVLLFSNTDKGYVPYAIASAGYNDIGTLAVDNSSIEKLKFKMESYVLDQFTVKEFLVFARLLDPMFEYEESGSITYFKQKGSFVHKLSANHKNYLFSNTVILNNHSNNMYSINKVIAEDRVMTPTLEVYKVLAQYNDDCILSRYRNDDICRMYRVLFNEDSTESLLIMLHAMRDKHKEYVTNLLKG